MAYIARKGEGRRKKEGFIGREWKGAKTCQKIHLHQPEIALVMIRSAPRLSLILLGRTRPISIRPLVSSSPPISLISIPIELPPSMPSVPVSPHAFRVPVIIMLSAEDMLRTVMLRAVAAVVSVARGIDIVEICRRIAAY